MAPQEHKGGGCISHLGSLELLGLDCNWGLTEQKKRGKRNAMPKKHLNRHPDWEGLGLNAVASAGASSMV